MRALIVACHPCEESYGRALRDTAIDALKARGAEVRLRDLYEEEFDPVMSAAERRGYHTRGANEIPVADHIADLRWCDALLFVFPTWWYGPPAMLKGWLDRVWVPYATFDMPKPGRPIRRVMSHIETLGVVTTLGSPWWWWTLRMRAPARRILMDGLKPLCHPRCRTLWLAHHRMDSSSAGSRARFLAQVSRRLARV